LKVEFIVELKGLFFHCLILYLIFIFYLFFPALVDQRSLQFALINKKNKFTTSTARARRLIHRIVTSIATNLTRIATTCHTTTACVRSYLIVAITAPTFGTFQYVLSFRREKEMNIYE
jgi:hypothetical protein